MSSIISALKEFGSKCNTQGIVPSGNTVDAVVSSIAANFNVGASISAIELTTKKGAVTGGKATLSNGETIEIIVKAE